VKFTPTKMAKQAAYYRAQGARGAADRLEAVLIEHRCCRHCGRALTNPESVARQIGPECWKKTP
jgi:hypothetical protein